jgi:hypothetical protein
MRAKSSLASVLRWFTAGLFLLGCTRLSARAAEDLKLQAQLVWATDDAKPPEGKNYKAVEPGIQKQLKALKWRNYFEVKRIDFSLAPVSTKKIALSDKCELDVKHTGKENLEVTLFGRGKQAAKQTQALPKGDILVLAGNAPNETAWLVIVKRVE